MLVSGLPILVFLMWPYSFFYNQKYEAVEESHLLMAQGIATSLEHYSSDLVAAMETFSADIVEGRAIGARPIFENLHFYRVCVVRKTDGLVISTYLGNEAQCGMRVSAQELATFEQITSDSSVGYGGITASDGPPLMTVIADVGDFFVQAAVQTTMFRELQENVRFGENGHAVITDHRGHIIAHPSTDWMDEGKLVANLPIVEAMMQQMTGVMTFSSPYYGEEMIAGYTFARGANWGVMVVQPVSEFGAVEARFMREVVLILLLGFLGSLCVAFYMARGTEARIKKIQNVVTAIANGFDGMPFEERKRGLNIKEFQSMETGITTMFRKISASETRYRDLFENVPIASREEDLSDFKQRVDALGITDVEIMEKYLDAHPEFIVGCGKSIKVIDANAASLALHAASDISELNDILKTDFKAESQNFIRQLIIAAVQGETRGTIETSITAISGEVRHLIATWCILSGYEGDWSRSLMTSIDVTEQLEAERALRHAHKMEALGQLTGGIAHDFNNLLTVMGGNAELLALDPSHESDLVEPIQNAVNRGAELTQRLLAFSRKQTLQPQSINMLALASEMGKILRRTLGPNIDTRILANKDDLYAHADPGQVEAALLNLAINARDAMPNGGLIELAFDLARPEDLEGLELESGDYIVCSVTDTGEGMSEETLSHAFEPFFTTKGVGKGSGLGLSMVYGFACQSGGTATIESSLGHGSTIRMFLPRTVDASVCTAREIESPANPEADGLRVLVLEDDDEVMKYLDKMLRGFGHHPLRASSIAAAWEIVDAGTAFDLLLSDVLLSGPQKGTDFAKELRLRSPDCPVIFISGYPNADHIEGCDQKTEWLAKPFSGRELAEMIMRLCPH